MMCPPLHEPAALARLIGRSSLGLDENETGGGAMKFNASFPFDHSPEVVRDYFADKEAIAYIAKNHREISSLEVVKSQQEGDKFLVTLRYTVDVPMPGPIKKVMGDLNTFLVDIILDTKNNKGTMEFTPAKMAGKIKAGGRITFEPRGDKWIQAVDGDVSVNIFGVGKLIEKFFVDSFQRSFADESRLRNEYINQARKKA
jgi:hypothetical protein